MLKIVIYEIRRLRCDFVSALQKVWRSLWNRGIKLLWYRLWVRKDEFHKSLNMDIDAMLDMTDAERKAYLNDLCKRRSLAHEREMWENT